MAMRYVFLVYQDAANEGGLEPLPCADLAAAMATASTLLFFLAPLELWSVFANLLSLPLVGAMFAAEFAVRLRLHPDLCQGGVLRSVRAYWERNASHSPGPR